MLGDFKLSNSVGKFFGDAYDLFKLGAKFYDAVKADEKEEKGFMSNRRPFNFDSNLRSARPTPQMMQAPVGLRAPNLQNAFRYFADKTARDVNLASVVARNYKAGMTKKRQNVNPNFAAGGFGNAGVGSARSNRVGRARFRTHLQS